MAVRVQGEDFDIGAEVARLTAGRTDIGAVVTFTGVVRAENDGTGVTGMTLEHYPGMTEAELARVAAAFLMDYLKTRAPFWKKELTGDGEERWVDARDSDEAAAKRW